MIACGPQEGSLATDGTWIGTVTTEDNVTTVVNESGSVWGGEAQLVEEISIGVDIGDDEYMFGWIRNVYATDESIYVTDSQVSAVRVYDTDGQFVRSIGSGPGQGPGEYENPTLVNGTVDGTIFVYDNGLPAPDGIRSGRRGDRRVGGRQRILLCLAHVGVAGRHIVDAGRSAAVCVTHRRGTLWSAGLQRDGRADRRHSLAPGSRVSEAHDRRREDPDGRPVQP